MGDTLKGDFKPNSVEGDAAHQLQAFKNTYPGLSELINSQILPAAQAQQNANAAVSPQQQALNAALYQQYSPVYSQTNAQTALQNLQGAGGQAALAGQKLQQQIDPEYYSQRSLIANKLQDLISNPISGSEVSAVEKANSRNAILGGQFQLPSNTQQLSGALNYAQAGRDRLGQALGLATQGLQGMKSGQDAFGQATGIQGTQNQTIGANQLGSNNLGQSAFGVGGQLLSQIGGAQNTQQQLEGQRRTVYDAVNQSYTAAGSGTAGMAAKCGACWIFKAKYHKDVPYWVRWARDFFYQQDNKTRKGYVRMGKLIIPFMRKYPWFMSLVDRFMLQPLVAYGGWMYNIKGYENGQRFVGYKIFWINFWKVLGRI